MNILLANWTWYPSGGDWTYLETITKIYTQNGHKIIPFSVKNAKNIENEFEQYFLETIDYKQFYNQGSPLSSLKAGFNMMYSYDAVKKLNLLLNNCKIDIAQLNNIHSYHTSSIIPILHKSKIPIFWRVLDYKLICPNSTFLSNGKVCEDCFNQKFYKCLTNKCKNNSLAASALLTIEAYFNKIVPFYNKIDKFIFQSEFTRDLFVKYGYDKNRTVIIENPFFYDDIVPNYFNHDYILYFGRISEEKGIKTLIHAMQNLPNIKLKIVGDGPMFEFYSNYTHNNKIKNIEFLGKKWGSELTPLINKCKFVVVPSEWYEPSGYVVLQAFSFGKPVVASDIGGLSDLVINNYNGLLFKPSSIYDLTNAINSLFFDNNNIINFGKNGRSTLELKHNPTKYYNDTMKLFKK